MALYYTSVVIVALAVLGAARLGRSKLGRAWRFIREDEDAAEAMGINTYRVKLAAYIAGAIWGGLAGVLFAAQLAAISPPSFTFLSVGARPHGGRARRNGLDPRRRARRHLHQHAARSFSGTLADYRYFVFGVLLIVVMIFRRQGCWPGHRTASQASDAVSARSSAHPTDGSHRGARRSCRSVTRGARRRRESPLLQVQDLHLAFGGVGPSTA